MARYQDYGTGSALRRFILPALIALIIIAIGACLIFMNPFKGPASSAGNETPVRNPQAGLSTLPLASTGTGTTTIVTEANMPRPVQTAASANPDAQKLIAEALAAANAQPSKVIEARQKLNNILALPLGLEQQKTVKANMSALADKWLFSKSIFADDKLCSSYKVKSGDKLATIAQQYKVPYEILMSINNIPKPEALQAGVNIKVINGPFRVTIYRSTFTMDLYCQDTFVRSFTIGIGKPGRETPKGLWVVKPGGKMVQPRWTDPDTNRTYEPTDPDYPLGSRWIGLDGIEGEAKGRDGFAIHGTKVPEEIGSATSRGCIRMYNGEVITMYNLLVPTYSKVEVVD